MTAHQYALCAGHGPWNIAGALEPHWLVHAHHSTTDLPAFDLNLSGAGQCAIMQGLRPIQMHRTDRLLATEQTLRSGQQIYASSRLGTIRPACSVQAPAAEPGSFSIQRSAPHAHQLPSWLPQAQPAYRQITALTMMLDCIEVRWNHITDSIALVPCLGPELGKSSRQRAMRICLGRCQKHAG